MKSYLQCNHDFFIIYIHAIQFFKAGEISMILDCEVPKRQFASVGWWSRNSLVIKNVLKMIVTEKKEKKNIVITRILDQRSQMKDRCLFKEI